jgi:hypothetical protein
MTDATDKDVDDEKGIEDATVQGAWHYLCVGVLTQAVTRAAEATNLWALKQNASVRYGIDKEGIHQRETAKRWLAGGVGTITFEDCCDAMGIDPDRAREKIQRYCYQRRRVKLPETEG